jgi:hypothetical protein
MQLLSILPHSKMANSARARRRSVVRGLPGRFRCWISSNNGGGIDGGTKKETRRLLSCRRVGRLALFGARRMLVGDFLGLVAQKSSWGLCSSRVSNSALSSLHSAGWYFMFSSDDCANWKQTFLIVIFRFYCMRCSRVEFGTFLTFLDYCRRYGDIRVSH